MVPEIDLRTNTKILVLPVIQSECVCQKTITKTSSRFIDHRITSHALHTSHFKFFKGSRKKVIFFSCPSTTALPPPLSSLVAIGTFFLSKISFKKVAFLIGPYPPSLLVPRPLRKTFSCDFPKSVGYITRSLSVLCSKPRNLVI